MMKFRSLCIFALLGALSCNDEVVNRPLFQTEAVTEITTQGATLNAKIVYQGGNQIDDYGFTWSQFGIPTLDFAPTYHANAKPTTATFSHNIEDDLVPGATYQVRCFLRTKNGIELGNIVKFVSQGGVPPVIANFTPTTGASQTLVTINGDHFTSLASEANVWIGPVYCLTQSATLKQLVVKMPDTEVAGKFPVIVKISSNTVTSTDLFTISGLNITSFSPVSGLAGSLVAIQGAGFSLTPSENIVKFGGVAAIVYPGGWARQLTVGVPAGISGLVDVTISVNQLTATAPSQFIVGAPEITDFTPHSGYSGRTLTITGNNFAPITYQNTVFFGAQQATVLSNSLTQLVVEIPFGFDFDFSSRVYSPVALTVSASNMQVTAASNFTPLYPWVQQQTLGAGRVLTARFSIGSYGYVGTGVQSASGNDLKDFWRYDPAGNSWSQIADFPGVARSCSFSFTMNGKGYVGGGTTKFSQPGSQILKDLWEYDPTNNSWTQKQDFPSLNTAESRVMSAMTIGSLAYVVDGSDVYDYDPALDQWTKHLNHFPGTFYSFNVSFGLGSKGYFGLGNRTDEFWEFDPGNDGWTRMPYYPQSYPYGVTSFTIGNLGYVGGSDSFYSFDPATHTWTRIADSFIGNAFPSGFAVNGKGYLSVNSSDDSTYQLYSLDPNY